MAEESIGNIKKGISILPPSEVGKSLSPEQLEENNKPLILSEIGNRFYSAASLYPTVPEGGVSTNILIWPKGNNPEQPVHITDIENEDLWNLSEYSINLLNLYPDSAVTFAISEDQRGITGNTRKALGTSIHTFHFQNYINVRQDLQTPKERSVMRSLREPFPHFVSMLFQEYLMNKVPQFEGFSIESEVNKNAVLDPFVNIGGVVLTDNEATPNADTIANFADIIPQIHNAYTDFHKEIMSIFFNNYEEVKTSKWTQQYIQRDMESIINLLQNNEFITDGNLTSFLVKAAKRIIQSDQEDISAELKIFRSPTYSVGAVKNKNGKMCLAVNPHFFSQRAGGLQTLGIEVPERIRYADKEPYGVVSQRTQRAREADQNIMRAIEAGYSKHITVESEEIISLENAQILILNIEPQKYDDDIESLIGDEVGKMIAIKKASLPEGTAFYDGPAFFPHRIRKGKDNQYYISGSNYPTEGYFRHVVLRDSESLKNELSKKNVQAYAGLAVSVLVEVHTDNGNKVIMIKSGPTEYAPDGIAQMPGGSYQQKSHAINLPNPVLLAQQELMEEMGLYIDTGHIQPYAYVNGSGQTNPTLIYKTQITENDFKQLSVLISDEQQHIDKDKAREFVLFSIEEEIPEKSTKGAQVVLQVYKQLSDKISAEERT